MKSKHFLFIAIAAQAALGQTYQQYFTGSGITGQLSLTGTVNLQQLAKGSAQVLTAKAAFSGPEAAPQSDPAKVVPLLHPPVIAGVRSTPKALGRSDAFASTVVKPGSTAELKSLSANASVGLFGFDGLTHAQQKNANGGNQYSVEPPSPSIAVGNGYILQGVNNAVQVYNTAGAPLLSSVLSSNQVFGLAPAIIQATNVAGPFPTDMRVYFDSGINRWFILQRAQDNDTSGQPLPSSHLYLAVSQTNDPTGGYNNYSMDTTDAFNFLGCPCFPDYLQIGSDQYGFYIAADEYNAYYPYFVDATILAISKNDLASGAAMPTTVRFVVPFSTGYEFAIQPATTPPGASTFLASGGVEFFVSSQGMFGIDSALAVWAMVNTSTLLTASPSLQLIMITTPTQQYSYPDVANQKSGTLTYGATLMPPGQLAVLDGGDDRVLSVTYSGGRLYATMATAVTDSTSRERVGGAYFILSPTLRAGVLNAPVLRQGMLIINGDHLLRPAIAVNPQGNGAIVFTVVGTDYYPSVAFVPISVTSTSTNVQIVAPGFGPEDGFSGYLSPGQVGDARWGDYATAVAAADGSIWMTAEYIPNLPRSLKANWGTYIFRYVP